MLLGESIALEYRMKKGESLSYKTIVHSEQEIKTPEQAGSTTSDVDMKMVQQCTDVAPDGTMTVDVTIESGTLKRDGETQELPNVGQTITLKMKKTGEIVHTSIDLPFEQPAFPTKKIKKGETWEGKSKISIPGKPQMVELIYKYTLGDFAKVLGYDVAVINVVCEETQIPIQEGIDQTLTAKGTTYFGHKDGRLVKSEVETKTTITSQDGEIKTAIKVVVELTDKPGSGVGVSAMGGDEFMIMK